MSGQVWSMITTICFALAMGFFLWSHIRLVNSIMRSIRVLESEVRQIYAVLSGCSMHPGARALLMTDAEDVPDTKTGVIEFLSKATKTDSLDLRKRMVATIEQCEDPVAKELHKKNLVDFDNSINLLDTIGADSDPEYVGKVMQDLLASLRATRKRNEGDLTDAT